MSGLAQNSIALDSTTHQVDSTLTLELTKDDAVLLRSYITELEYYNSLRLLGNEKIKLLESKNITCMSTVDNYIAQLELAQSTLAKQVEIQEKKDEQHYKDVKDSRKKGLKQGGALGVILTLVICLLVI